MKKHYLIALLALAFQFANAQLEPVAYRGAFAPTGAQWTDSWTNWNPNSEAYTDPASSNIVTITANITSNTTWTTGKTYKLNGTIYVTNNATLTIQPGVIVKGIYSNTGTALVITKGSKINAVGTASAPIVFTSDKPANSRAAGDWGGVILLGKSKFNQSGGLNNIEGLPANALTEYGGGSTPDVHDNSGIMKYCRIEFGGFVFSPNNEINGLTFGAVGDGTTIDYVQVSFSGDDSFEWFGGNVNCKHLVAYRGLDDDLDTDNGYAGTVQYALCIRDPQISDNPAISTSEGFESDNNPGDVEPIAGTTNTSAIFSNCTMIGPNKRNTGTLASGYQRSLRLRRRTELKVINTVFLDWTHNYAGLTDDSTIAKAIKGELKLNNNIFAGFYGTDFASYPEGINPRTKVVTAAMASIIGTVNPPVNSGSTFNLGTWMTAHNNATQASSDGILTLPYNTTLSDYSNLDYRPGSSSIAASGADFTDPKIAPFVTAAITGSTPQTSPLSICQGSIATPLTATMTSTGVSLKWYKSTTLSGTKTPITGNALPNTAMAGTQYFWVSQLDASGTESDKTGLVVTVVAKPTATFTSFSNITSDSANVTPITTFAAGLYVGTTTAFKFQISAALTDSSLTYHWSVPSGVNIVSGGGASNNFIEVNFAGVTPDFVGTVGTISVQAQNSNGCLGVAKTLAITTALPAAPASIKVTDTSLSGTAATTAITKLGKYAGTTTPLTLTAAASASASSYVWYLPAGVNVVGLTGGTALPNKVYFVYPFSGTPGSGNTSAGAHKWTLSSTKYTVDVNGVSTEITVSTAKQEILGGSGIAAGVTQNPFVPYGTVISSNLNAIKVNFSGVSSTTPALYIGVRAKNGAGMSNTVNTTNTDIPSDNTTYASAIPGLFNKTYSEEYHAPVLSTLTPATSSWTVSGYVLSTSKLLKLVGAAPTAISSLTMKNGATAVTNASKYVGTSTELTLTATAPAEAASYTWTLPTGVTQISGGTSNVITVNLSGVASGVTSPLVFTVKANNVYGSSADKTLSLAATAPAMVSKVVITGTTTLPSVDTVSFNGASKNYTITPSVLANTYVITAPVGCVVTSASHSDNAVNTLETADLYFTVVYPSGYTSTTASPKSLSIVAKNGVGSSSPKTYVVKSSTTGKTEAVVTNTAIYPNPVTETLNIDLTSETKGDLQMTIYNYDGTIVSQTKTINLEEGTNSLNENVSTLDKGIYFVRFTNSANEEVIVKKIIKN